MAWQTIPYMVVSFLQKIAMPALKMLLYVK